VLITSLDNEKVRLARSLQRKKDRVAQGRFLAEGTRLIETAESAGQRPALVFYERSGLDKDTRLRQLVARLARRTTELYEVNGAVMRSLAGTETPQGIVAVYPLPALEPEPAPGLILVLDQVRDPGNVGAILRTAWGAGVQSVLLAPGTADAFNPKVVRAAMGAHFYVPILSRTWDEIAAVLAPIPRVYLAESDGANDYAAVDWTVPCALIIGGEAEGAGEQARALARITIHIPMPGRAESLNAAVAAGILLFNALRANT
jgi:TrmH family RNA methyltransferase